MKTIQNNNSSTEIHVSVFFVDKKKKTVQFRLEIKEKMGRSELNKIIRGLFFYIKCKNSHNVR